MRKDEVQLLPCIFFLKKRGEANMAKCYHHLDTWCSYTSVNCIIPVLAHPRQEEAPGEALPCSQLY